MCSVSSGNFTKETPCEVLMDSSRQDVKKCQTRKDGKTWRS